MLLMISKLQRQQTVESLDLLKHSWWFWNWFKCLIFEQVRLLEMLTLLCCVIHDNAKATEMHYEKEHFLKKALNIIERCSNIIYKRNTQQFHIFCNVFLDLHTFFSACISSSLPFWCFLLATFSFCTMWKTTCSFFPVRSSSSDWFRMVIVTSLSKKSFATASIIPGQQL